VNLSSLDRNSQFGSVNLYDPTAIGTSEITFAVLQSLGLTLETDIATNLLAGIESASNNFSAPSVSADTFETVAQLMRLGAKKTQMTGFPRPINPFTQSIAQPIMPVRSQPFTVPQSIPAANPSPDWLQPKVYKTSGGQI